MIQCFACFERIQDYCRQPISPFPVQEPPLSPLVHGETEMKDMKSASESDDTNTPPLVSFLNQSFAWGKAGPAVLNSLNFQIQPRRITAILGPTASGKSTLLQSLIGETVELDGQTERNFSAAAYCSQVPWLTNGSLRDNIIGASPLDDAWYSSVLHACVLKEDIARLPHKDHTKVGSNGVNLSGGQRQRVVSLSTTNLASSCLFVEIC